MTDKRSGYDSGGPLNRFAPGNRVRITSSDFKGLIGVVKKLPGCADHVLAVDGWPDGMYLIVTNAAVARLEPDENDAS